MYNADLTKIYICLNYFLFSTVNATKYTKIIYDFQQHD
jgi:hypothetical protein